MCGLVGIAGDTGFKFKDMFTELLVVDSFRGMHATGMASVKRYGDEDMVVAKRSGNPFELLGTKDYKDALNLQCKVLLGHNRHATIGDHTEKNAHPFVFENVVGAHNGTLDKWVVKNLFEADKFGTDSQAIFSHINKFGLRSTLDIIQGAWALEWFDRRDNTINFLRNTKRPLHYCYSADRCTMLWASEVEMLKFVFERHNIKPFEDAYYVIEPDVHFSWEIPKLNNVKFDAPFKKEMKASEYKWEKTSNSFMHGGYGCWDGDDWSEYEVLPAQQQTNRQNLESGTTIKAPIPTGGSGTTTVSGGGTVIILDDKRSEKTKLRMKSDGSVGIIREDTKKFRPPYKDHQHRTINKKKFNEIVASGCIFCDDEKTYKWGDFIKILPPDTMGRPMFLCEECYNTDDVLEICTFQMAE